MIDIKELRALLSAASPTPWRAVIGEDQPVGYYRGLIGLAANADRGGYTSVVSDAPGARCVENVPENARLIAAAVNALPDLLDEVERLRRLEAGGL